MFSSRAGLNGKDENSAVFTKSLLYQTLVAANCRHSMAYDNRKWFSKSGKVRYAGRIILKMRRSTPV